MYEFGCVLVQLSRREVKKGTTPGATKTGGINPTTAPTRTRGTTDKKKRSVTTR